MLGSSPGMGGFWSDDSGCAANPEAALPSWLHNPGMHDPIDMIHIVTPTMTSAVWNVGHVTDMS